MKFYKYLYVGDTIKEPSKIKNKLKRHTALSVYVICIASGDDQLEIYKSIFLRQKYYRANPPIIVGIASNYDEAVGLVVRITEDCIRESGNCNLKEYLKGKAKGILK